MESNVHLSPSEKDLFCNAEIILTKNAIIRKTVLMLEQLQQAMMEETAGNKICSVPPKISRGENYLGLPYVILDYPRVSDNGNILFIRSMVWWGHFYSSTLQLSGDFKQLQQERLRNSFEKLRNLGYYIGVNNDPWMHHFEKSNYIAISELKPSSFASVVSERGHIKIAAKWPLEEWDAAALRLWESWKVLLALVT